MNRRMRLIELLPDVACVPSDLEISGLVQDSRVVAPGDAFVAIGPTLNSPSSAHGLNFVTQAKAAGASTILFEPPMPADIALPESLDLPLIAVPQLRDRLGEMADHFYGETTRAMTIVGVTGTNGKTSTVQLLAQAWTLRGRRAGTHRNARRRPVWSSRTDRVHYAAGPAIASIARALARTGRRCGGDGSQFACARSRARRRRALQSRCVHQLDARPFGLPRHDGCLRCGESANCSLGRSWSRQRSISTTFSVASCMRHCQPACAASA